MESINRAKIKKLKSILDSARFATIVTHTHPDGDAMGSTMAMWDFLSLREPHKNQPNGIESQIIIPNDYPKYLHFNTNHICETIFDDAIINAEMNPEGAKEWISKSDLIIALDFNSFHRTDSLEALLKESPAKKVLIDHHINPELESFDLVFSETEISSTCELVYYIFEKFAVTYINEAIPTHLFLGMTTDTNNFANSVYPSTFEMASRLLPYVNRDEILYNLYNKYRENRFRAMGDFLLNKLTILPSGFSYVIFDKETQEKFDLQEGETESFVNIPLGIENVQYSIFLKEDIGYFRVSIRSKKGFSARQLAEKYFNGGGHENAAGGRLFFPGDIEKPEMAAKYIEEKTAQFVQQD